MNAEQDVETLHREINSAYGTDPIHWLAAKKVIESRWLAAHDEAIRAEELRTTADFIDSQHRDCPDECAQDIATGMRVRAKSFARTTDTKAGGNG